VANSGYKSLTNLEMKSVFKPDNTASLISFISALLSFGSFAELRGTDSKNTGFEITIARYSTSVSIERLTHNTE
jgi:hypothetical protein